MTGAKGEEVFEEARLQCVVFRSVRWHQHELCLVSPNCVYRYVFVRETKQTRSVNIINRFAVCPIKWEVKRQTVHSRPQVQFRGQNGSNTHANIGPSRRPQGELSLDIIGPFLDCWVGSLDFHLLVEIKVCPLNPPKSEELFAGGPCSNQASRWQHDIRATVKPRVRSGCLTRSPS